MEALVVTSRAISQDKFLQRENKRRYSQHVRKVGDISGQKSHPILQLVKETQKMTSTLHRSKSFAKDFKMNETKTELKRQNRIMLQKIWKINSNIKFNQTSHTTLQHVSGSNWHYKKKQADQIKEQNRRIASNLIGKRADVKQYKKKIQQEIKEYMNLKNQIRKCKYASNTPNNGVQRSKSQRKTFDLKLREESEKLDEVEQKQKLQHTLKNSKKPQDILKTQQKKSQVEEEIQIQSELAQTAR